jgi:hypothetical protein
MNQRGTVRCKKRPIKDLRRIVKIVRRQMMAKGGW